MKKKQVVLTVLGASSMAVLAVAGVNALNAANFSAIGVEGCTECVGNHYTGSDHGNGGRNSNGLREYWVCCNCHKHYLSTADIPGYKAENFQDAGASKVSKTAENDDRVWFGGKNTIYKTNKLTGATITVDGVKDEAWSQAIGYDFQWKGWGDQNPPVCADAKLYTLWDTNRLYVLVEVTDSTNGRRDFTKDQSYGISEDDAVELQIDTCHNITQATDSWGGGWGGDYRNRNGDKAVEGKFVTAAGYDFDAQKNTNRGCDFAWDRWFSNRCQESSDGNVTHIKSAITSTGYNMEYVINLGQAHIVSPEIGLGVKVYDKKSSRGVQAGVICFEDINDGMDGGPRKLSNFTLVGFGE